MRNKKGKVCMLACDKICDDCGDCERCGLLDILSTIEEPSEDEIIEQLIYESEREADLM